MNKILFISALLRICKTLFKKGNSLNHRLDGIQYQTIYMQLLPLIPNSISLGEIKKRGEP